MDRRPGPSRVICSTRQPGIGQSLFILRSMGSDASPSKPQPRPAQSTQTAGEPLQRGRIRVGRGFSGIGNADKLKRHESRRRTMAHVADHLSVSALEQQYRSCTDVTAARHFQTIWLLAKGHDLAQVSATVSYARRWAER